MRVDDQPPNFRQDPTQDFFKEGAICKNKCPNVNAFKAISVKCMLTTSLRSRRYSRARENGKPILSCPRIPPATQASLRLSLSPIQNSKGVNLSQKVGGGTYFKLGGSGGILPEICF